MLSDPSPLNRYKRYVFQKTDRRNYLKYSGDAVLVIYDSLDAKVRQGLDSIFLSIYQVLWDYMLYPYDLDYIIENKIVVKKVLDEIWKN